MSMYYTELARHPQQTARSSVLAAAGSYEIHVYGGGAWKIHYVLSDKAEACLLARRLARDTRWLAVKVIEETLSPSTGRAHVRTVFRKTRVDQQSVESVKRVTKPPVQPEWTTRHSRSGGSNPFVLLTLATLISFGGLAGLYGLQILRFAL